MNMKELLPNLIMGATILIVLGCAIYQFLKKPNKNKDDDNDFDTTDLYIVEDDSILN